MTQVLMSLLAVISRKEREIKEVFRLFRTIERELEAAEKRGSFIHPRKADEWVQLDARVSQLSNELQKLYAERDAAKVADAAANDVHKHVALLDAPARRKHRKVHGKRYRVKNPVRPKAVQPKPAKKDKADKKSKAEKKHMRQQQAA